MTLPGYYLGQRLSLKSQTCTVRYIGPVDSKAGEWLGVEWDDQTRGKHNGEHAGHKYFECQSSQPTAASFLRPNQTWDEPRTFLQALRAKYVDGTNSAGSSEVIYVSGKQAEEVGFDKFARRQAALRGIFVLVLDRMCIRHTLSPGVEDDRAKILEVCAGITDLDLGYNLFESLDEIMDLCARLPKLRSLSLDGNRFSISSGALSSSLVGIRTLSLSDTFLTPDSMAELVTKSFPNANSLTASSNEWRSTGSGDVQLTGVQALELSSNSFSTLSDASGLVGPQVRSLNSKRNPINKVSNSPPSGTWSNIEDLDLSHNAITSLSFFDDLSLHLPSLQHLRVTGNPVYQDLKSAEGKPLTAEDGYMLTVARLPNLSALNYSKISEKERLNAEAYYLKQIATQLTLAPEAQGKQILALHPRWQALCEEYGQPALKRGVQEGEDDPNSLAARLVAITFRPSNNKAQEWVEELPKSLNIYSVLGIVSKKLNAAPLSLRLIWETGERDPIGWVEHENAGPESWDSDEDDAEDDKTKTDENGSWEQREVGLIPGTRALGTYIESKTALIRVETRA